MSALSPVLGAALAVKSRYEINVTHAPYGAKGDGATDDRAAIQRAIDAANAMPFGGIVYFPPGRYRINSAGGRLIMKSGVTLRGAGRDKSVIYKDDSAGGGGFTVLDNITIFPDFTPISNVSLVDLGFLGRADVDRTASTGQLVHLSADDITVTGCGFSYSRQMGLNLARCSRVVVTNNRVFRTIADGIAVWDCGAAIISDNEIVGANDDAISCAASNNLPNPKRSGVIISGNVITESQGINVTGAKSVIITDNVLQRIMGSGIRVVAQAGASTGLTAQFACRIAGNTITDVFQRSEPSPRNTMLLGILVAGGARTAGAGASTPGEPVVGTGVVTSLYGASGGSGTLYYSETGGTGARPAMMGVDICDNVIMRTLPAVTNISEWGHSDSGQWVGDNGDGSGFYNGAITDAALSPVGIAIDPALWDCRISRNYVRTGGAYAIEFRTTVSVASGDFRSLAITDNKLIDFVTNGIRLPQTATSHRIRIEGNEFDGDPLFRHANRGAGGTWAAGTTPVGIAADNPIGTLIERNHFRNTAVNVSGNLVTKATSLRDNYIYGTAAGLNFNAGNKGCGTMHPNGGRGWTTIPEDSDPASATYGQILGDIALSQSTMPAAGTYVRGVIVENTNPVQSGGKVLLGWRRMTTGSGHVLNTDWTAIYGTTT